MKTNTQFLIPLTFLFVGAAQAAVSPTIKAVSVTPTTAPAGTMFKFTAELNAPLTTGNKVKIDLGKGLALMTGAKTSYSLSRVLYTTGSQTYKVGIYNAKNVLQSKVSSGNYTVSNKITPTNTPPALKLVSGKDSIQVEDIYTLELKATDNDNNLMSITVNWQDSSGFNGSSNNPSIVTQRAENNTKLKFTHSYNIGGKFLITAIAEDSNGLKSKAVSKLINVVVPETPNGKFSKVCNSGSLEGEEDCPVNPTLGIKLTDWACTKDNDTGLIWEVKTNDGGLHDYQNKYTNFIEDNDPKKLYGTKNNADVFIKYVNSQGLCGANDWRMPTIEELSGIDKHGLIPSVDPKYFPNTEGYPGYWSTSIDNKDMIHTGNPWLADFSDENVVWNRWHYRGSEAYVRLVRSDMTLQ